MNNENSHSHCSPLISLITFIFTLKLTNLLIFIIKSHFLIADMPTQMPPLTPGTNKKLTEVLKASFASWEKEVQNCNTRKGKQNDHYF